MATSLMHRGLESAAKRFPDHAAVLAGDDRWTYGELDRAANALAQHLSDRGIGRGDRVAVMTSNRPEFVVTVHAVSKVGAAPVMLNSSWKSLEVGTALGLTDPRYGVADGAGVALLAEYLGAGAVLDLDDAAAAAVIDRTSSAPPPLVALETTDDAAFVFSSGTTDSPKAVRHTHGSIDLGTAHWVAALGLTEEDRFQVATPPSHILGLLNLLAAAAAGATVRLHRRFDLDEELRCIQDERMTLEMAVAPIALAMASHPDLESYDLSSLRYVMWGATPITPSVADRVSARSGVRWLPAYGTSEVPVIAANPVADPDRWRLDSAGLPVGGVSLRVVDLDTGEVLPSGAVGEVQVLSASAMAGYLPDDATAGAFDDGWYRTGDVGWLEPEGWVHLTDRRKEMIKVSAFQVAPAEIEAVLHGHPAVVDCAVFGVPDERAGEVPVAAVQLEPGSAVTAEDLARLVADTLATYKRVHHVVLVEAIPRTPSGKVLRRTLREEWAPTFANVGRLMDVRLSPEQVALRDAAAQVVDRLGVHGVAELDDTERAAKLDAAVDASGWRELRTATDDGTPWASAVEVALVAEELGRGLADAPFLGATLAAELRRRAGAPPAGGYETVALRVDLGELAADEGGHVPPGVLALDARGADAALVFVGAATGWTLGAVALELPVRGVDLTRPVASVGLPGRVTAVDGQARPLGADDVTAWQSLGLAVTSADLVGVMRGALALTTDYARERRQYGTAIGSFQAVQHLLADALVAMEGSRSIALHAAWAVDALPASDALAAASAAKAYCARAARAVCETAIQVHGGIGNTWECLAHVFLRRALLSSDVLGGVGPNLARVLAARNIGGDDGFR